MFSIPMERRLEHTQKVNRRWVSLAYKCYKTRRHRLNQERKKKQRNTLDGFWDIEYPDANKRLFETAVGTEEQQAHMTATHLRRKIEDIRLEDTPVEE